MKRKLAFCFVLCILLVSMMSLVAIATEVVTEAPAEEFDPDQLIINGVALAPIISIIISILKGWVGIDKRYIPLINVILGAIAVLVYGIVTEGLTPLSAVVMTIGVVFGSSVFHDTFGHAAQALSEVFEKKQDPLPPEELPSS